MTRTSSPSAPPFVAVTRAGMIAFGLAAIAWGVAVLPIFWRQAPIERMAGRIVAGEPFKPEVLADAMPVVEEAETAAWCRAAALHAAAIIRLRLAEEAIATAERAAIDERLDRLRDTIGRSLACAPADPFLWLVLFWAENTRNGFRPHNLAYLRLSYLLGPNEGWIALKRSRFALALYDQLPPDLREMAVGEFPRLLAAGFYDETVALLTGPGWPLRDILLPRLKDVDIRRRELFAKLLRGQDYEVDVPGVPRPPTRLPPKLVIP
jgi:hypothetical protein